MRSISLVIGFWSQHLHLCFFVQAEDGIRDRNVTGVQTCALPIFEAERLDKLRAIQRMATEGDDPDDFLRACVEARMNIVISGGRSEERRVGKECRVRMEGVCREAQGRGSTRVARDTTQRYGGVE